MKSLKQLFLEVTSGKYPSKRDIISHLRNNMVSRVPYKVLDVYIVGSEAKGTARPDSDLDIAIIIPPSDRVSAIKRTEAYHQKFTRESQKPYWNGRVLDFQFFYPDDPELNGYKKIPLE